MKIVYTDENRKLKILGELTNSKELRDFLSKNIRSMMKYSSGSDRLEPTLVKNEVNKFFKDYNLFISDDVKHAHGIGNNNAYSVKDLATDEFIGRFSVNSDMFSSVYYYAQDISGNVVSNSYLMGKNGISLERANQVDWNHYEFGPVDDAISLIEEAIEWGILEKGPNGGIMALQKSEDEYDAWFEIPIIEAAKDKEVQNATEMLKTMIEELNDEKNFWNELKVKADSFKTQGELEKFAKQVYNFEYALSENNPHLNSYRDKQHEILVNHIEDRLEEEFYKWEMVNPETDLFMKRKFSVEHFAFDFVKISDDATLDNLYHYSYVLAEATVDFSRIRQDEIHYVLDNSFGYHYFSDFMNDNGLSLEKAYAKLAEAFYGYSFIKKNISDETYPVWNEAKEALVEKYDIHYDKLYLAHKEYDFTLVSLDGERYTQEEMLQDWKYELENDLMDDETLDQRMEEYPFRSWILDQIESGIYEMIPTNSVKQSVISNSSLEDKIKFAKKEVQNHAVSDNDKNIETLIER